MVRQILMPQVGQDIDTARLVEWKVAVGEVVAANDIVAMVESDKATFEVEALAEGVVLKRLLEEGEEGRVLEPIAYIGLPGEDISLESGSGASASAASPVESAAPRKEQPVPAQVDRPLAAPAARRLAREHGIDLSAIRGTGPGGRIVRQDVLAAIAASADAGSPGPGILEDRLRRDKENLAEGSAAEEVFSRMRRRIAERLTYSKQNIPHFYMYVDVNMSAALGWREGYNHERSDKATITDMIVKAVAEALARFPRLNAHVAEDRLLRHKDINIGVAVAVEDGLVVPVVANAGRLSLEQISRQMREITTGARRRVLKAQAVGTFTISNLGMSGVGMFLPIINPPECAILGVGSISKRPLAVNDTEVRVADVMTLALACDHRAVDGTYAAAFLNELRKNLEGFSC